MKRMTLMLVSSIVALSLVLTACQPSTEATEAPDVNEATEEVVEEAEAETSEVSETEEAETAEEEVKAGGVLKIGTNQSPTVLGYTPMITNNSYIQYNRTAFDSLTFFDEEGNITPWLAKDWEIDAEAKTIIFYLEEGVKFHDGTDFNAEAVKWNIEEYQENQRTEVANIESVDIIDENTIQLNLVDWNSSTLLAVGFFVYYMSPTAVEENGVEWAQKNAVGTGPFMLTSFEEGIAAKYEKFDEYWQEGKPYLDGVEFYIIDEPATSTASLQAGEIDMVTYADLLEVKNLLEAGEFIRETNSNGQGVESTGVIPSSSDPDDPFSDPLVRKAFCYAIDVDSLIEAFGYGLLEKTNQWAAPGSITYNPEVEGYPYNPDKAIELLEEAGYPDGFDTKIWVFANDEWHTAIAEMLNDVGIRAEIAVADGAQLMSNMGDGWEGIMYHWASIGPDLGLYMGRHLDPEGAYFADGIQHPEDTLALLEQIRTATDEESKTEYSMELQKLIYDEYALFGLPLYVQSINAMKYPYVKDDCFALYFVSAWTPADAWLDK